VSAASRTPTWRSLPLDDAAALLRLAGRTLVLQALRAEPPTPVGSLASPEQARRLTPRNRSAADPPTGGLSPETLRARLHAGGLSERCWRASLEARVTELLGPSTAHAVPGMLWPLVARRAWEDPAFRRDTAARVRATLAERFLFEHGAVPGPSLAAGTYWTLIALSPPPRPPRGRLRALAARVAERVLPGQRRRRRLGEHLRREATEQALTAPPDEGWARFWDQFVLAAALAAWPEALSGADPRLGAALAALPLVRELGGGAPAPSPDDPTGPRRLAHPDWNRCRPAWFDTQCERPGG
jgi:hypothetical protein